MNVAPITDNPSYLDAADEWLLNNDPELAGLAPKILCNRRRRENHRSGGKIWDEQVLDLDDDNPAQPQALPDLDLSRFARYRAERDLIQAIQDCPTLAEAARELGISRQAVTKTYHRLLQRAQAQYDVRQAMVRWDSLPLSPIPWVDPQGQMDLFGGAQ